MTRFRHTGLWPVIPPPARPLPRAARLLLAGEILVIYARAYRLMRVTSLPVALERLRSHPAPGRSRGDAGERATALRVSRAARKTLERLPTDRRCLVRSLVVSGLLARRGIDAQLVLGVRPDGSQPFVAHAWVEHDGEPVMPDAGYRRLHAF